MRLMMDILAALATGLWQTIKALFRRLRGLLLALMLVLNLGMIAVPMVYDMASRVFWGVVSIASASYALRAETRAARRASLDQIEADRDSAQRRAAELDAERVRLRGERDALEAELDATRQREASALARLDEVELDRHRLTAANRQVQNQVADKVQRMQGRSMEAVARNMGAAYTETIPVLGTAFVIGGIVFDVWDTCQTLDDMHEIGRLMEFNSNDENEIEAQWCGLTFQETWNALAGGPTGPKQACIEARLRSVETAPPECEGFELPSGDPLRSADPQPEQVPLPDGTDPMRE
jgi:hypothetical protein